MDYDCTKSRSSRSQGGCIELSDNNEKAKYVMIGGGVHYYGDIKESVKVNLIIHS